MDICYLGAKKASPGVGYFSLVETFPDAYIKEIDAEREGSDVISDFLLQHFDWALIDVTRINLSEEEIADLARRLKETSKARFIIFAGGFYENSSLILTLKAMGFSMFILSTVIGDIRDRLRYYTEFPASDTPDSLAEEIVCSKEEKRKKALHENPGLEEKAPRDPKKELRIGVIGSIDRIGTTTAACQIVKAFNASSERSACYIEDNTSGYLEDLEMTYNLEDVIPSVGYRRFGACDLFSDVKKILNIREMGYSVFVYDYGTEMKDSIYEKDVIILVGGCKATEIRKTTDAMRPFYGLKNVLYLFNFTPDYEKSTIISYQEAVGSRTFFMPYVPDMFELSGFFLDFKKEIEELIKREDPSVSKRKNRLGRMFGK